MLHCYNITWHALQTSFMGRSIPVVNGARAVSQMASRSFVFGRGDSNSAGPPDDGMDTAVQVCASCTTLCHSHTSLQPVEVG